MDEFVTTLDEIRGNILKYQQDISNGTHLAKEIKRAHVWYGLLMPDGGWLVAPSKSIGYRIPDPDGERADPRHGWATEKALSKFAIPVTPGSREEIAISTAVETLCARYGKTLRVSFKLKLIPPQQRSVSDAPFGAPDVDPMRYVVSMPDICGGRPCIRGTRIRVSDILDMLAAGESAETIIADFPSLKRDAVVAAILYAARSIDHRIVRAA